VQSHALFTLYNLLAYQPNLWCPIAAETPAQDATLEHCALPHSKQHPSPPGGQSLPCSLHGRAQRPQVELCDCLTLSVVVQVGATGRARSLVLPWFCNAFHALWVCKCAISAFRQSQGLDTGRGGRPQQPRNTKVNTRCCCVLGHKESPCQCLCMRVAE
jgi:hypothetical protein